MTKVQIVPAEVAKADRSHMLTALGAFASKPPSAWLALGHPGGKGQLPNNWVSVKALPPAQVIETLATTVPLHCADGWSYASLALTAVLQGDFHGARHLAYYAQLRAGLSILANLGIGVFNGINFVVTSSGTIQRLDSVTASNKKKRGLGTHDVVWDVLKHWATDATLSAQFLDLLKVRGNSLRDCIVAIWPGFAPVGATSNLITAWGLDLRRGKNEHLHRKTSSYHPQALNPITGSTADTLEFVEGLWDLFGRGMLSSFDKIDRVLLRSILQAQHDVAVGGQDYATGAIHTRYSELPHAIQTLVDPGYLEAVPPALPDLMRRAQSTADPATPCEMIARAMMLLRVATGFTHTSLLEAGVNLANGDLRPWLDALAADRGFWPAADPLDDPADLWNEVELALSDLTQSRNPAPLDLNTWLYSSKHGRPTIHQAERIVVWSLSA